MSRWILRALLLTALVTQATQFASAQPFVEWEYVWGGTESEWFAAVDVTPDGRIVAAGMTVPDFESGRDGLLSRLSTAGGLDPTWSRSPRIVGSEESECFEAVQVTRDGGVLAAGATTLISGFYIARFDSSGELWSDWLQNPLMLGWSGTSMATGILETDDGGCVVVGWNSPRGVDSIRVFVLKLDSTGRPDRAWAQNPRIYGGADLRLRPYAMCEASAGGYVIAGDSGPRAFFLRVDEHGELNSNWLENPLIYTRGYVDNARSIAETADGSFVAAGWGSPQQGVSSDVLVLKLNDEGVLDPSWEVNPRTFGESYHEETYAVRPTDDGGLLVGGITWDERTSRNDWYLAKLDASGEFDASWPENPIVYRTARDMRLWDLATLPDGGFAAVGSVRAFGAGREDAYVVKFSSQPRRFVRGDANADGVVNLTDGIATLEWLFAGASPPPCLEAADVDASRRIDLADAVAVFQWLFAEQSELIASPAPSSAAYGSEDCGTDETLRGTRWGCESLSPSCSDT